jgi:hypothetical protein
MLHPPLARQVFFPAQVLVAVAQPPLPLHSFKPLQHAFSPLAAGSPAAPAAAVAASSVALCAEAGSAVAPPHATPIKPAAAAAATLPKFSFIISSLLNEFEEPPEFVQSCSAP